MSSLRMEDCRLEKLVISSGLGGLDRMEIQKIGSHLTQLLHLPHPLALTTCKNPVATWKTRKGQPMGLRGSIRKVGPGVLRILTPRVDWTKARYDSSSLRLGVPSHRALNLEKFNFRTPEYGFTITLVFGFKGSRAWTRRINPCRTRKPLVPESWCRAILARSC